MRYNQSILVIGGMGFIGSHFVERLLLKHAGCRVAVVDDNKTNYLDYVRHSIIIESISNIDKLLATYSFDIVVNFLSPQLISNSYRLIQVITDQDSVPEADIVIRLSHCYGPRQSVNSFIPKMIMRAIKQEFLTVYGSGLVTHDWVYVSDCCDAIDKVLSLGGDAKIYDICSGFSISNVDIARSILKKLQLPMSLIEYTDDVLQGFMVHTDHAALEKLGWQPTVEFDQGLDDTIKWFQNVTE